MKLKLAILESGRTQRSLAKEVGMREDRLSEILQEAIKAREDERQALARALNQPVETLFGQG